MFESGKIYIHCSWKPAISRKKLPNNGSSFLQRKEGEKFVNLIDHLLNTKTSNRWQKDRKYKKQYILLVFDWFLQKISQNLSTQLWMWAKPHKKCIFGQNTPCNHPMSIAYNCQDKGMFWNIFFCKKNFCQNIEVNYLP